MAGSLSDPTPYRATTPTRSGVQIEEQYAASSNTVTFSQAQTDEPGEAEVGSCTVKPPGKPVPDATRPWRSPLSCTAPVSRS